MRKNGMESHGASTENGSETAMRMEGSENLTACAFAPTPTTGAYELVRCGQGGGTVPSAVRLLKYLLAPR